MEAAAIIVRSSGNGCEMMDDFPVTFFLAAPDDALAQWRALRPDATPQHLLRGEDYWIALTYARLRDAGMPVRLDNRVPDGGVVVFYAGDKRALRAGLRGDSRVLCVAVRSDRHPVGFADFEVVQNRAAADGTRALYIPHWTQPGLIPRDPARGSLLRTVLFPGTPQNLDEGFRSSRWHAFLAARGIGFRGHETVAAAAAWHDLRDVDALLAIRPARLGVIANKPAWKLFNAWSGGVPAILGPELGYRELRRDQLDYLEAADVDEAMTALARLQDEPALYAAMVEHGRAKATEFGDAATCARWRVLIEGLLQPAAAAQRRQSLASVRWRRRRSALVARLRRLVP